MYGATIRQDSIESQRNAPHVAPPASAPHQRLLQRPPHVMLVETFNEEERTHSASATHEDREDVCTEQCSAFCRALLRFWHRDPLDSLIRFASFLSAHFRLL